MPFRVPTSQVPDSLLRRINTNRHAIDVLREQLITGKRINRPSDDPIGAEVVISLRASRAEIEQYQTATITARQKLNAADNAFNNYQRNLDRSNALISGGLSDITTQSAKNALADELDAIRTGIISFANTRNGDEFVFGGTRQGEPPVDPVTGVFSTNPANTQYIQIEPGSNALSIGVIGESFLVEGGVSIFEDLVSASAALRGTGDAAADSLALEAAFARISQFQDLAASARSTIGVNQQAVETASDRLEALDLTVRENISNIEDVDFAEAALALGDSENALEATLSIATRAQQSLLDYLR